MDNILDKFTNNFKKAISHAFNLSLELNHYQVKPEHLLYALIQQKGSVAADVLSKMKIKADNLKNRIIHSQPIIPVLGQEPEFSINTRRVIEKAVLTANLHNHQYVGTEHLLIGLSQLKEKSWLVFLSQNQIDLEKIRHYAPLLLKSTSRFPEITDQTETKEMTPGHPFLPGLEKNASPLELFTTNLTDDTIQKNIDPVIGRAEEIQRLIQILSRRTKNNPILLGEAGVGKTAIVEGLAKKIMLGEVPDILLDKKIISLDLSSTVAGTMFRGEFENRLKQIIEEIKNDSNLILFIDELHNIIGAGSAQGSLDAANILKPALARGQLRCIGATTLNEYKKHIENDPALERRFQAILVEEPSLDKTKEILKGIKENYEKYHQVNITDEALTAAVNLSQRYLTDSFLPDKAIDLIDEAASGKRIKKGKDKNISLLEAQEKSLREIQKLKQQAVQEENFSQALQLKNQEKELADQLELLRQKVASQKVKSMGQVTKKDIVEIIAKITKIPINNLLATEKDKLLNLEKIISQKIIGQEEAIQTIAQSIRRARAGIANQNRPLGSFIFLGPSGVGKTELAKVLAETVFNSPKALIRLDMSEFSEGFNVSKLIGAPAGYVGYKDTNKLTDAVKHKPYSIVLFDEIEKAHPETFNLLLQILEDGQLTDATGKMVNFKNTIIIMTSNIGLRELNKNACLGFETQAGQPQDQSDQQYQQIKEKVLAELKEQFRPEFLNRLDKIIVFKPLDKESIKKIVKLQLVELNNRLKDLGIQITLNNQSLDYLANKSFVPEEGGRAVRKTIQELLENKLADQILQKTLKAGSLVTANLEQDEIIIN